MYILSILMYVYGAYTICWSSMQGMRLMCRMHFTDRYDILEDQMLRNHMKLEKKKLIQ